MVIFLPVLSARWRIDRRRDFARRRPDLPGSRPRTRRGGAIAERRGTRKTGPPCLADADARIGALLAADASCGLSRSKPRSGSAAASFTGTGPLAATVLDSAAWSHRLRAAGTANMRVAGPIHRFVGRTRLCRAGARPRYTFPAIWSGFADLGLPAGFSPASTGFTMGSSATMSPGCSSASWCSAASSPSGDVATAWTASRHCSMRCSSRRRAMASCG